MAIAPRRPDCVLALDNNVLNAWRTRQLGIVDAIAAYIAEVKCPPAIPAHCIFEVIHGFEKIAHLQGGLSPRSLLDKEKVKSLINNCQVLPFNQASAEIAAYIYPRLTKSQRNTHWGDMFIASTALAHDYGVATRNRVDFELISKYTPPSYPKLRIEVW